MTTKSKQEMLLNPIEIMANGALAEASKKPTALVPQGAEFTLSTSSVVQTKAIVKALSKAEKDSETIEGVVSGQVDNLRDLMLVGSPDAVKQVVVYKQYKAVSALFIRSWIEERKLPDDEKGTATALRAFNRYYGQTDLEIPLSDDADAIRKREAKAKKEAEMKAIADIPKAIDDAVALMDFDLAKKLKAEDARRKLSEAKDKNAKIEEELKPIKDAIRDELKLCLDKAILVRVVDLLRKK